MATADLAGRCLSGSWLAAPLPTFQSGGRDERNNVTGIPPVSWRGRGIGGYRIDFAWDYAHSALADFAGRRRVDDCDGWRDDSSHDTRRNQFRHYYGDSVCRGH